MKAPFALLLLLACLPAVAGVTYSSFSIHTIASANPTTSNLPTHVQVTGWVVSKSKQSDGDWHIAVCDSNSFTSFDRFHCINAEVVPYLQCNPLPAKGAQVTLNGTLRFDGPQDWWEIHPVEHISGRTCLSTGIPPL
jgi:hypothetical protein